MSRAIVDYLEMLKSSGVDLVCHSEAKPKPACRQAGISDQRDPSPAAPVQDDNKPLSNRERLIELREQVMACTKCGDLAKRRRHVVFGAGNASASLVFVGEAPGEEEDRQGLPFVGAAGQLLTKIIESIGLTRQQVFIMNVLKCRPPGNRNPLPDEIMNCEPYLVEQLTLIQPKIICTLGNFASQTLLKTASSISVLRGRFHDYRGIPVMCTFHPAYLLRNPGDKRKVWEDMKMIRARLAGQTS